MSDLVVYSVGICYASVCAPVEMRLEDVEADVNRQHPTGIESEWRKSDDETFANGPAYPNPCPCENDPTRQHWLLEC